jgi:hypothetical protein
MIKAYICHPYSSDPEGNIEKVRNICKEIAHESVKHMDAELNIVDPLGDYITPFNSYNCRDAVVVPVAPHLLFPKFMSEDGGVSRDAAMAFCLGLMSICDELWVCSKEVTEGMRREIEYASTWAIRVVFWEGSEEEQD